jgi:hypothetical protein
LSFSFFGDGDDACVRQRRGASLWAFADEGAVSGWPLGCLRDRQEDVTADQSGESSRVVQQIERRNMVAAADMVLPAVARPEEDPGVAAR